MLLYYICIVFILFFTLYLNSGNNFSVKSHPNRIIAISPGELNSTSLC